MVPPGDGRIGSGYRFNSRKLFKRRVTVIWRGKNDRFKGGVSTPSYQCPLILAIGIVAGKGFPGSKGPAGEKTASSAICPSGPGFRRFCFARRLRPVAESPTEPVPIASAVVGCLRPGGIGDGDKIANPELKFDSPTVP
jgi:hypothetical protein